MWSVCPILSLPAETVRARPHTTCVTPGTPHHDAPTLATMQTMEPVASASWSRAAVPLATGAAIGAAAVYVGLVTPGEGRTIPCPFHAATGWWCPGCGMTRAVHNLLRGDVAAALAYNVFVPLVVVGALVGWWSWFSARMWDRPVRWPSRVDNRWWFALFGVFIVYGVLRNVPAFAALGP